MTRSQSPGCGITYLFTTRERIKRALSFNQLDLLCENAPVTLANALYVPYLRTTAIGLYILPQGPGFHSTQQYLTLSQELDTCYRVSRVRLLPFP